MSAFKIETHDSLDKSFQIEGPGDLTLHVDYDDVDRDEVDTLAQELVNVMNYHYAQKSAVVPNYGGAPTDEFGDPL